MRKSALLTPTILVLVAAPVCFSQTRPASPPPQDAPIVANAEEVTLDLIVRDKHGKAVRDLTPADLHVTDDGKPVKITSLRLVEGLTHPASSVKSDLRNFRLVFLLFDEMQRDAAKLAGEAALEMIKTAAENNVYFAVLKVDHRLRLYQGFTTDRDAIRRAVEIASSGVKTQRGDDSDAARNALHSFASNGNAMQDLDRGNFSSLGTADRLMAQMLMQTIQDSERISRDEQARPSLAGLLALTTQAAKVPGRKSVVYFSQGLTLSSRTKDTLDTIVGLANRSNISVYAVDASGISTQAKNQAASLLAAQATQSSFSSFAGSSALSGVVAPHGGSTPSLNTVTPDQAKVFDTLEQAVTASNQIPLMHLSAATGGFYIGDTNDLRKPARQIMEQIETYYEASYAPNILQYDGRFRAISVKTTRPHLTVQARSGYYSLPPNAGPGVRPFETPMLAALMQPQLPADLAFRAAVLRFGKTPAGDLNSVTLEFPLRDAEFKPDPNAKLFGFHLCVLALVKNKSGEVLDKFSQDIPYQAALETEDRVRSGYYTFQRPFTEPPGDYILEAALMDRNSGKMGGQRIPFQIAEQDHGPVLSDVAVVRRLDPLPPRSDGTELFRYQNSKVVPDLSGAVGRDKKAVSVFFVVYPDPQIADKPSLELEVMRDGAPAGRVPMDLPPAAKDGRIPFMASIPADALGPGKYELVATVSQGKATAERSARFTLEGVELARATTPAAPVMGPKTMHAPQAPEPEIKDVPDIAFERKPLTITPVKNASTTPEQAELDRMIEGARKRAVDYADALPNFTCIEVTHRAVDPSGRKNWRHQDTISELLRYHDHLEQRNTLEVNGGRTSVSRSDMKGTISNGEFGSLLLAIFDPKVKAQLRWTETATLGTGAVQVFTFQVPRGRSRYMLVAGPNEAQIKVGCHGKVYIDAQTYGIRRIEMDADAIPADYPMRAAFISIDYDYVTIGDHDFLLPIAGEVDVRQGKRFLVRNQMEFRDYKRYGAESNIKFE